MAFKPIYGYSGDHPVLDFPGVKPVCMESPCPFAEGEFELIDTNNPAEWNIVNEGLVTTVTATANDAGLSLVGHIHLFYKGNANVSFAFACSSSPALACVVHTLVKPSSNSSARIVLANYENSPITPLYYGSLPVPYYRYCAWVNFFTGAAGAHIGDYLRLTITP